ncbi:penicillin-binding protein activator [Chitiniphilus purpureus]|uniref:Penicillin-binding protein activator n=1 Tax=Chitiniphilus purpureus TaxID=2981137 RepID=A0ABY6DR92_9NEIS|nr:penicillin-binding protein activator [Chitiniphilus sp. CD1]UXY16743.1 penicillin-binding protein activator [Chitiniphilus sp. CD1]
MHALGLLARRGRRLMALALYGALVLAASGCASPPPAPRETPLVLQPRPTAVPTPLPSPVVELRPLADEPVRSGQPVTPVAAPPGPAFIGLLLPTQSKTWRAAAEAVRAGALAAERALAVPGAPPLQTIDTSDNEQDILGAFQRAQAQGAVAVIGPLTKGAVSYLGDSAQFDFPVIALNNFSEETLRRPNLYSFNLSLEYEARQAVRFVADQGANRPVVVVAGGVLARRMAQGFSEGWREERNGQPLLVQVEGNDFAQVRERVAAAGGDAVFLAADSRMARRIRPFLGNELPVFSSSQIDPGNLGPAALVDLAGIRFLDMPWLANPGDPTYDFYRRTRSRSNDIERLFAMGVDAYRLALALLEKQPAQVYIADGLTGRLSIAADGTVLRELVPRSLTASHTDLPEAPPPVEPLPAL